MKRKRPKKKLRRVDGEAVKAALNFADQLESCQAVETIKACLEAFLPPPPKPPSPPIPPKSDSDSDPPKQRTPTEPKPHKNLGAADYPDAPREDVAHEELCAGDRCPDCAAQGLAVGKLYSLKPSAFLHWMGQLPLMVKVYLLARLRCSNCKKIFTAKCPESTRGQKYSAGAKAILALLKYGLGFPFYRLQRLQNMLDMPLPAATQWLMLKECFSDIEPVVGAFWHHLREHTVQVMIDDTHFKILDLVQENKRDPTRKRTGMRITAMRARDEEGRILHLFVPGRNHAGENMGLVFANRDPSKNRFIQMCDALAANSDHTVQVVIAHCWSHVLRRFREHGEDPDARYVLSIIGQLYDHDRLCQARGLVGRTRKRYLQRHCRPICQQLNRWMKQQFGQRRIEPASRLGQDINYVLNHWQGFIAFLNHPDVPLDNNGCERIVKEVIVQRKNSLFFKTETGALIGMGFTSLISTCQALGIDPFDYLIDLQEHASALRHEPAAWLPWVWAERQKAQNQSAQKQTA